MEIKTGLIVILTNSVPCGSTKTVNILDCYFTIPMLGIVPAIAPVFRVSIIGLERGGPKEG